jgi:hypothetical protein
MVFTQSANWILARLTGSMRRRFAASLVVALLPTLLGCGGQSATPRLAAILYFAKDIRRMVRNQTAAV